MKILAISVSQVLVILIISIASLQIALECTKRYLNDYEESIFLRQIEFSSNIQSFISFRLSIEILKLPLNLNILNSFQEKIIEGTVKKNNHYKPSILNIIETYNQNLNLDLNQLVVKSIMSVNSWYQQNATQISELDIQGQEILNNLTLLIPLMNAIQHQSNQNISNIFTIPYRLTTIFDSKEGIILTNFVNSSLNIKLQSSNCYKGLFDYDPRCRFFYLNNLNQTSIFMNAPQISASAIPYYLSQYVCQRSLYQNQFNLKIENHHITCFELLLSNIYNYFENIIQSSKQYYVIDPRTLLVFFNSKKQYNYTNITQADNFYSIELEYLQDQNQAKQILKFIEQTFNKWIFSQQNDSYMNIDLFFEFSKQVIIQDYVRNGTTYKAIFNPVIQYDQLPKYITKYIKQQSLLLEYAYLQINIISDEDLKAQTNELNNIFSRQYIITQIVLIGINFIILLIAVNYAINIQNHIYKPIGRMIKLLEKINQLKEIAEISQILKKYEERDQFLTLPQEIYQLYLSFLDLFQMIQYTSDNFFEGNEGEILISLSKKVDFFKKFKNYPALGITYNNIGNILLKQEHYFQALENFQLAAMYAKYEITIYYQQNPNSLHQNFLQAYSFAFAETEQISQKQESQIQTVAYHKKSFTPKSHFLKQSLQSSQKKQKFETSNNQSYFSQDFDLNKSNKQQIQELILNLFYRQQNQIITLISFQEQLDKKQNLKKQFQFWKEIKKLTKNQINLLNYDNEISYLNIFMNCLISKCYYKQFQYFKAKQHFEIAQQVLSNLLQQKQVKILQVVSEHFKSIPIFDQTEKYQQNKTVLTKKNSHSPNSSNKFSLSIQIAQQKIQSNQTKYFHFDLSDSINNSKENKHEKSEFIDLNSFGASQMMLLGKKIPNQESQSSLIQQAVLNQNKQFSPQNDQIQFSSSYNKFDLLNNTQKNDYNKNYQINLRILQQNLNQYIQYSLSEYFIYKKKYKKAAEILTELLENSQNITSNVPFRIVYSLKQIFDSYKIQDTLLYEEYSRFNKNLSYQIVICFEINSNQGFQQRNKKYKIQSQSDNFLNQFDSTKHLKENQIILIQKLISEVLNKSFDQLCLFTLDLEEQCLLQNTKLINPKLFKQTQSDIFDRLGTLNSNSSLFLSHQSQFYSSDKSQNIEKLSFDRQKTNVSHHFNQLQEEEEDYLKKNKQQITKQPKKVFITDLNQINKSLKNVISTQKSINQFALSLKEQSQFNYQNLQPNLQNEDQIQNKIKNNQQSQQNNYQNYIAQSLDQLISYQYAYKIAEHHFKQIFNPSKSKFEVYKQYMSKQLGGLEQEKPLKFIIYQTEQINIQKESLFINMCNILVELNIQIIIFQTQLNDTPLEQTFNQTYIHKTESSQREIFSETLIFSRTVKSWRSTQAQRSLIEKPVLQNQFLKTKSAGLTQDQSIIIDGLVIMNKKERKKEKSQITNAQIQIEMKLIAISVIPVLLIFFVAIASLQIALSYTKEYINQYGQNVFQNQIKFSSNTESIISFRLTREIYKIPVYISMLNSLHEKITQREVIMSHNYRPSTVNQMLLYQQKLTPDLTKLAFKNKMYVNSWYQQNVTQINQLDVLGQEILYNLTRLIPFLNTIQYQSRLNISNVITIPYSQVNIFTSQEGIVLTNFANSSLSSKLDSNTCYKGKFVYDPRCRFFYLSKKVEFFTKFQNYSAAGVTHNNIGNILLNQEHFFQALEHLSLSIMYAKYEISAYYQSNPHSQYANLLYQYSYAEYINFQTEVEEGSQRNVSVSQKLVNKNTSFSKQRQPSKEKRFTNDIQELNTQGYIQRNPSISTNKFLTTKTHFSKSRKYTSDKKQNNENLSEQCNTKQHSIKMKTSSFVNSQNAKSSKLIFQQSEENHQIQELILNLFYRQQNYIVTLMAFQESLNSSTNKSDDQKSFNFWKEIKRLIKGQLKLIDYFPEIQYLKVFMNCLISKCYYNQFKYEKTKQKLKQAEVILLNLEKVQEQKEKELPNLTENVTQQNETVLDFRKQAQSKYFNELDHQQQQSHNPQKFMCPSMKIKQNQLQTLIPQKLDTSDIIHNTSINIQFTQNQNLESQNSFETQQKILTRTAEILTNLYESSQNMTSNIPFRIVYKLKQIFDAHKIQDLSLFEEYSRFNKNISLQIIISLEVLRMPNLTFARTFNECSNQRF
ncbi:hypothetical protein ABPG73_000234 [Tetrahymena malaccensis]